MSHDHHKRFGFEKLAKLDAPERKLRQPAKRLIDALAPRPGDTVVDLGVGAGYFALPAAQAVAAGEPPGHVYGVDAEPRMLEELVRRAAAAGLGAVVRPVLVSGADAEPLPIDDGAARIVLAGNLVHELDDRAAAFAEVVRILEPGGRFAIVDWAKVDDPEYGPPADHRLAPELLERELLAAGFGQLERLELYEDYYVIVASRPARASA